MDLPPEIEQLRELIEPTLNGWQIVGHSSQYLTNPGENYGSILTRILLKMCKCDQVKDIEIVAKLPPLNPTLQEIFQTPITFAKENHFYMAIIPLIQDFLAKNNQPPLDVFPKFYSARISLDPTSTTVDENAVLLMENLKIIGFELENRMIGFNEQTAFFIIARLARLHALPIALKLRNHAEFERTILTKLTKIDIDAGMGASIEEQLQRVLANDIDSLTELSDEYKNRVLLQMAKCRELQKDLSIRSDTPYTTIVHNDFWINNVMIKKVNGITNGIKIVDYQLTICDSFAHDFIFFWMTSVATELIPKLFHKACSIYYDSFNDFLKTNAGDYSLDAFSFDRFMDEVRRVAPLEIHHIISMLRVVLIKEESSVNVCDYSTDLFLQNDIVDRRYFDRLQTVLSMYQKYDWIHE